MRWWVWLSIAALALGGCHRRPAGPITVRPDWRGASIDGIAPLMTPRAVQLALDRHGYRQVPCSSRDTLLNDPLNRGNALSCYRSPREPLFVTLYFLDLHEGRRLAVANFGEPFSSDVSDAARIAHCRAFARRLRTRYGRPSIMTGEAGLRLIYWNRPGGVPSLPDTVSTTIDRYSGANATLTSMWAYGEERPAKR